MQKTSRIIKTIPFISYYFGHPTCLRKAMITPEWECCTPRCVCFGCHACLMGPRYFWAALSYVFVQMGIMILEVANRNERLGSMWDVRRLPINQQLPFGKLFSPLHRPCCAVGLAAPLTSLRCRARCAVYLIVDLAMGLCRKGYSSLDLPSGGVPRRIASG